MQIICHTHTYVFMFKLKYTSEFRTFTEKERDRCGSVDNGNVTAVCLVIKSKWRGRAKSDTIKSETR